MKQVFIFLVEDDKRHEGMTARAIAAEIEIGQDGERYAATNWERHQRDQKKMCSPRQHVYATMSNGGQPLFAL